MFTSGNLSGTGSYYTAMTGMVNDTKTYAHARTQARTHAHTHKHNAQNNACIWSRGFLVYVSAGVLCVSRVGFLWDPKRGKEV